MEAEQRNKIYYTQGLVENPDSEVHLSSNVRVGMVLSGRCQLQLHSATQQLQENDIYFFTADVPYAIFSAEDRPILFEINIFPEYFQEFCPELTNQDFEIFHIPNNVYDKVYQQICRILAGIAFSGIADGDTSHLQELTYVNQLVLTLSTQFGTRQIRQEGKNDYVRQRMDQALRYIHDHYWERLTLDDISGYLGLHPQYFSTFFKKHFQMGFLDYLNLYRVNRSLTELMNSSKTILEIALDCGFNSHKTYCNAFRKVYGCLPSQYREDRNQPETDEAGRDETAPSSYFQYLWSYWEQPEQDIEVIPQKGLVLEMNLERAPVLKRDDRLKVICVGSGFYLMQQKVVEQLRRLASECGFNYVHIRDIFSDLLKVYRDSGNNTPLYYWDDLDTVIDTILGVGMLPFLGIGYMPRDLASGSFELGYSYHPNMSPPKSAEGWAGLIRAFLRHYIWRYGSENVRQWKFNFWNSANVQFENGYWSGTREEFFNLYRVTWETFKEVDPELSLGSPNFSLPDGMNWYEEFFLYCKEHGIRPDFLDVHLYSCMDAMEENPGIFPYPATTYNYLSLTGTEYIRNILRFLHDMLEKFGMEDLPVIASEWNITYYLLDLVRDTAFIAPYICLTLSQTIDLVGGMSWFALSDLNDQTRSSSLPFPGNSGVFDSHSVPKPSYHAFYLYHKLDRDILGIGDSYLITRSDAGYHILIYNMAEYDKNLTQSELGYMSDAHRYNVFKPTDTIRFHGVFAVEEGMYQMKRYQLDRENGSVFDIWQKMGSPHELLEDVCKYLQQASVPALQLKTLGRIRTLTVEGEVPPHGVLLFEIERVRMHYDLE